MKLRVSLGGALITVVASVNAQGRLLAIDNNGPLYELNLTTGAKTQIANLGFAHGNWTGIAYDGSTNTVFASTVNGNTLCTIDLANGSVTTVGMFGFPDRGIVEIEIDSSTGKLYGGSHVDDNLYEIDKSTGLATLVGPSGLQSTSFSPAYNSQSNVMYGAATGMSPGFYRLDRMTGAATFIGSFNVGVSNPRGLAFNRDNGQMYMMSLGNLYTVNMLTGAGTLVGDSGTSSIAGLAYVHQPVPEPATLAATVVGAACLRRRRKKA